MTTTHKGHARGKPQGHRRPSYDPSSGQSWRTGVLVYPDEALKAITAADGAGLSFAGLVNELIRRMPVDENGLPTWTDELFGVAEQKELPMTG